MHPEYNYIEYNNILRERFRHMAAMHSMSGVQMIRYLEDIVIADHICDKSCVWCAVALRIAKDVGKLPLHLHNRFLMEPSGGNFVKDYLDMFGVQ